MSLVNEFPSRLGAWLTQPHGIRVLFEATIGRTLQGSTEKCTVSIRCSSHVRRTGDFHFPSGDYLRLHKLQGNGQGRGAEKGSLALHV